MGRKKLPRTQRQARHRERVSRQQARANGRRRSDELHDLLAKGIWEYQVAVVRGRALESGQITQRRVICERCLLEQDYLEIDDSEQNDDFVYVCEGLDGMGCGSEICMSTERYLEACMNARRDKRLEANVLKETTGQTALLCGHFTGSQPVAIYPDRRKLYDCPQGCGLVKAKR